VIIEKDPDGQEIRLGTTSDVARELGETIERVRAMYRRRTGNGFPEHVAVRKAKNGTRARHWDIDEVRVWAINR
jgi:hypothetical protein